MVVTVNLHSLHLTVGAVFSYSNNPGPATRPGTRFLVVEDLPFTTYPVKSRYGYIQYSDKIPVGVKFKVTAIDTSKGTVTIQTLEHVISIPVTSATGGTNMIGKVYVGYVVSTKKVALGTSSDEKAERIYGEVSELLYTAEPFVAKDENIARNIVTAKAATDNDVVFDDPLITVQVIVKAVAE